MAAACIRREISWAAISFIWCVTAFDGRTIRSCFDSIKVIDRILKHDLPQGPGWRRYNHDGYGQKDDGSAYDGTGVGRCWPILTGERGHYELAAGRDPKPFITTIEDFSNEGGMLTEQIWDGPDLPHARMKRGCPTGAAMPLCWSHAEYVSLVRSRHDGVCFPRVEPAYQRYVVNPVPNRFEIWTLRHPMKRMPRGKILRIILAEQASITWTNDNWQRTNKSADATSGPTESLVRRFSNQGMASRFSICVYNFLGARSTLGEPQLADKYCVRTGPRSRETSRRVAAIAGSRIPGLLSQLIVTNWFPLWRGSND